VIVVFFYLQKILKMNNKFFYFSKVDCDVYFYEDTPYWNNYSDASTFDCKTKNLKWNDLLERCFPDFSKNAFYSSNDIECVLKWNKLNTGLLFEWTRNIISTIFHTSMEQRLFKQKIVDFSKEHNHNFSDIVVCDSITQFKIKNANTDPTPPKNRFALFCLKKISVYFSNNDYSTRNQIPNIEKLSWKIIYEFMDQLQKQPNESPNQIVLMDHLSKCEPIIWINHSDQSCFQYMYKNMLIFSNHKKWTDRLFSDYVQKNDYASISLKTNVPCIFKIQMETQNKTACLRWNIKKCTIDDEGKHLYKCVFMDQKNNINCFDINQKINWLLQLLLNCVHLLKQYDSSRWSCQSIIQIQTNDKWIYNYTEKHVRCLFGKSSSSNKSVIEMKTWESAWKFLYTMKPFIKINHWKDLSININNKKKK